MSFDVRHAAAENQHEDSEQSNAQARRDLYLIRPDKPGRRFKVNQSNGGRASIADSSCRAEEIEKTAAYELREVVTPPKRAGRCAVTE